MLLSAAGGAYWPLTTDPCTFLEPSPSVGGGAPRPLTPSCPPSACPYPLPMPGLPIPPSTPPSPPSVSDANTAPGPFLFHCPVSGPHGGGHWALAIGRGALRQTLPCRRCRGGGDCQTGSVRTPAGASGCTHRFEFCETNGVHCVSQATGGLHVHRARVGRPSPLPLGAPPTPAPAMPHTTSSPRPRGSGGARSTLCQNFDVRQSNARSQAPIPTGRRTSSRGRLGGVPAALVRPPAPEAGETVHRPAPQPRTPRASASAGAAPLPPTSGPGSCSPHGLFPQRDV